jgi:hypothetical protein
LPAGVRRRPQINRDTISDIQKFKGGEKMSVENEKQRERAAFWEGYQAALFDTAIFLTSVLKKKERLEFFMRETEKIQEETKNEKRP